MQLIHISLMNYLSRGTQVSNSDTLNYIKMPRINGFNLNSLFPLPLNTKRHMINPLFFSSSQKQKSREATVDNGSISVPGKSEKPDSRLSLKSIGMGSQVRWIFTVYSNFHVLWNGKGGKFSWARSRDPRNRLSYWGIQTEWGHVRHSCM